MWKRKRFHVFQVWSEVPAQAELCLPPEAEAQDRVRDDRPVRVCRAGGLPRGIGRDKRDLSDRGAAAHQQREQLKGELGDTSAAVGLFSKCGLEK